MHTETALTPLVTSTKPVKLARGSRSDIVGVIRAHEEYRLVAIKPIVAKQRLFRIEGEQTNIATRHSLQTAPGKHIDLLPGRSTEVVLDRFFWRYMNHHCEPNTLIRQLSVIALRDIAPWEDITFNYNTTEYDMSSPFDCRCGSPVCSGKIQGARHMNVAERERLRPLIARCLREDLLPEP